MAGTGKKRGRGRPPLPPGEGKRANFTTRLSDDLKRRLEDAARDGGYSLSEEIERRLERSLLADDGMGGPRTAALLRFLAGYTRVIGYQDDDWVGDYEAYYDVIAKWHDFLKNHGPTPPLDPKEVEATALKMVNDYLWPRYREKSIEEIRDRVAKSVFSAPELREPVMRYLEQRVAERDGQATGPKEPAKVEEGARKLAEMFWQLHKGTVLETQPAMPIEKILDIIDSWPQAHVRERVRAYFQQRLAEEGGEMPPQQAGREMPARKPH